MALRSFREGDRVKVFVISVDTEKRRLSLGLKPSYFGETDFQEDEEASEEESDAEPESLGVIDNGEENGSDEEEAGNPMDEDEDADDSDAMDEDDVVDLSVQADLFKAGTSTSLPKPRAAAAAPLDLGPGFQWSAADNQEEDGQDSSSDDDDEAPAQSKKRKRKEIEQDLTADLQTKTPESNADFERLLLGSPSSSYLWVQYMSFQLQLSEVEKARELARRALKTINFREEQEKLNVWLALLNLENVYGTDESLEATFKDAARHMESKTVHLRMAAIFEQSEKFEVRIFIAD